MQILSFKIENYKSFYSTDDISLSSGFNVIIGENNVGKTALLEALTLQVGSSPHRSTKTMPYKNANPDPRSRISISIEVSKEELIEHLDRQGEFYVPIADNIPNVQNTLTNSFTDNNIIKLIYEDGTFKTAYLPKFGAKLA